jgi:RND family efflux transporter MFP subunit
MTPLRKIFFPFLLLLLGAAGGFALFKSRQPVVPVEINTPPPLVRVTVVEVADHPLSVSAQGTVLPRTETLLASQVAGEVIWVSPAFEVGAFFRRGETLLRLDPRDYELEVKRSEAEVAQAQVRITREQAEAELARQEWQELGQGEPGPLVLHQPQLAEAKATLAAAEAILAKTRLSLDRTRLRAPFAGRLRNQSVGLGQFLSPGQQVASLQAIDYAEIRLPLADDQLAFLDLPSAYRDRPAGPGPKVTLRANFAGSRHTWTGTIVRSEGELDPQSRLLNLVARVPDPYGSGDQSEVGSERPPLAVGLFVEAEIEGRTARDSILLPRSALRDEEDGQAQVLVVDAENRLRFRPVEVLRLDHDQVLLGQGLEAGERVCISPLDVALDGMPVRTTPTPSQTSRQSASGAS